MVTASITRKVLEHQKVAGDEYQSGFSQEETELEDLPVAFFD